MTEIKKIEELARDAARMVAWNYVKHFIMDGDRYDFEIRFDMTGEIGFYWANPINLNDNRDPVFERVAFGDLDPEGLITAENAEEAVEVLEENLYSQYISDPTIVGWFLDLDIA